MDVFTNIYIIYTYIYMIYTYVYQSPAVCASRIRAGRCRYLKIRIFESLNLWEAECLYTYTYINISSMQINTYIYIITLLPSLSKSAHFQTPTFQTAFKLSNHRPRSSAFSSGRFPTWRPLPKRSCLKSNPGSRALSPRIRGSCNRWRVSRSVRIVYAILHYHVVSNHIYIYIYICVCTLYYMRKERVEASPSLLPF
jgi:hypothetical protein